MQTTIKTPVYIWREDIVIRDVAEHPVSSRPVTPAENAANLLSNLPACDVEELFKILVASARYSVEKGETDQEMLTRMECDYLRLTSTYKQTFG